MFRSRDEIQTEVKEWVLGRRKSNELQLKGRKEDRMNMDINKVVVVFFFETGIGGVLTSSL